MASLIFPLNDDIDKRKKQKIRASPTFMENGLADITFGRKFCCGKQYPENFARNLCGLG